MERTLLQSEIHLLLTCLLAIVLIDRGDLQVRYRWRWSGHDRRVRPGRACKAHAKRDEDNAGANSALAFGIWNLHLGLSSCGSSRFGFLQDTARHNFMSDMLHELKFKHRSPTIAEEEDDDQNTGVV